MTDHNRVLGVDHADGEDRTVRERVRPDLSGLGTLVEAQAAPRAAQKEGKPIPIAKKERQATKKQRDDEFREAIWTLDEGKCRATGKPLVRSGTLDWEKLGEVDHAYERSTSPELIYDVSNGILLQKFLNRLRKVRCARAPEFRRFDYTGPHNRRLPQTFTWRDDDGTITKQTVDGVPVKKWRGK